MGDTRASRAAALHQAAADAEARAHEAATRMRVERDLIVRELRAEDPKVWTYPHLAVAIGCSPELIWQVVKGRTSRDTTTTPQE